MRAALLAALLALAPPVAADQAAPELAALFRQLHGAADAGEAQAVEARIWSLWHESGDARVDGLLARGIGAMEAGDLKRAVALFGEAAELAPRFAEAWNKRATAYYLMGDLAASVADIRRTLALEPRHFGAISGMGLIFLARGDLRGALDAFERVLAIHPRSPSARVHVQRIRERLRERAA